MAGPVASIESNVPERPNIGTVQILVKDWQPGQSEIRIQLPSEARGSGSAVAARQAQFLALVVSELDAAVKAMNNG